MHSDEEVHTQEDQQMDDEHYDEEVHDDEYMHDGDEKHDEADKEMINAENANELKDDQEMADLEKVDSKKTEEEKVDSEQVGADQATNDDQIGSLIFVTQNKKTDLPPSTSSLSLSSNYGPLLDVLVYVIPEQSTPTPLTTTLPTPPTSSEAPTITTIVPDPLPVVLQRLFDLEIKFEAWTKVDHSKAIEESVQANIINEVKNQLPNFLPKLVSDFVNLRIESIVCDVLQKNPAFLAQSIASGEANPDKVLRKRHCDEDQDPPARSNKEKTRNKPMNVEEPLHEAEMDVEEPILNDVFSINHIKLDKITKSDLVGPVYKLLKGTCKSSIELEYNMDQCYNALTDQLDWTNPKASGKTDHAKLGMSGWWKEIFRYSDTQKSSLKSQSVQNKAFQWRMFDSFQDKEKYEHVGPKVTRSQEGKRLQDDEEMINNLWSYEAQDHKSIKHARISSKITTSDSQDKE
ncbi:hypothetical protein Tco_1293020 [Tanacetum coccineum]